MIFLAINWTNALIVTLLGFTFVFILLILLVFILKLFGVIMKKKNRKVYREPTLEGVPASMISGGATDGEQAAIALAIKMFYDEDCNETGKLTLKATPTAWNAKIYGINNIDK